MSGRRQRDGFRLCGAHLLDAEGRRRQQCVDPRRRFRRLDRRQQPGRDRHRRRCRRRSSRRPSTPALIADAGDVEKVLSRAATARCVDARPPEYFTRQSSRPTPSAPTGIFRGAINVDSADFYDHSDQPAARRRRNSPRSPRAFPTSRSGHQLLQHRPLVVDRLVRAVRTTWPQGREALLRLDGRLDVESEPAGHVLAHQVGRHQEILRPRNLTSRQSAPDKPVMTADDVAPSRHDRCNSGSTGLRRRGRARHRADDRARADRRQPLSAVLLVLGFGLGAAFLKFEFSFTASWRRFLTRGEAGGLLAILLLIAILAVAVVPVATSWPHFGGSIAPIGAIARRRCVRVRHRHAARERLRLRHALYRRRRLRPHAGHACASSSSAACSEA